MSAPARVAVVMLTAVGDMVHTLPVVRSLRAAWPQARIGWAGQPGPLGLVEPLGAADELLVFDRGAGVRGFRALRRQAGREPFDLVLVLQSYFKAGLVAALLPAARRIGFDRRRARDLTWLLAGEHLPPRPRAHVQDELLEFLDYLGVERRLEWGLGPTEEERARYAGLLPESDRRTVAFVVGTSKPEKEWPAARYAAVADALHADLGVRTVLVGGKSPRESAAAEAIRRAAAHAPLDLREWDLRRVASLLDRADVLVSPDTGPLHVGVALGTPTVALMGYTNPKRYGPYRRFHDLMLDAYGDPGEDYPLAGAHRPGRMARITVEQVVEKVETALEKYPRPSST
ncbi:MAG TPA: glycosyltransferase family 9 protein [Longimicrobiaceae bacterium]|nr:glycosyltransferase family 9 protein [Longimicrobiaceae bacterium]